MSISYDINPYLRARLEAVQNAYKEAGLRGGASASSVAMTVPSPAVPKSWKDLFKKDEDEGDGGGGRGTMKGLRGKDAENAKNAMRKLTRNR